MISTLIKTVTAADASSIDFVDGTSDVVLDGTYDHYMFVFTDIAPETANAEFQFQVNATDDAGGGYDTSLITSAVFYATHDESDSTPGFNYVAGDDLAQSSSPQFLAAEMYDDADSALGGVMHLFSPASTTYVKHFKSRVIFNGSNTKASDTHTAGYINDTTAIDEIRFNMDNGNMSGTIQLYGIA